MRAVPVPDSDVWPHAIRRTISPPGGDLTDPDCSPCDAVIDSEGLRGGMRYCMKIALEPGDLERLQEDPHFWLVLHVDRLVPFGFGFPGSEEESDGSAENTGGDV